MSTLVTNNIQNLAGTASTSADNVINGSAKAWVNFNGTGTVAIRASYNVSSITDNGTGTYTVNFTNAFADANYSATGTSGHQVGTAGDIIAVIRTATGEEPTVTNFKIETRRSSTGSTVDVSYVFAAVFR